MHNKKKIGTGLIISDLTLLFNFMGKLIKESFFVSLFTNYNRISKSAYESKTEKTIARISGANTRVLRFKNGCARLSENSLLMHSLNKVSVNFFSTSLRSVGIFLLSAGGLISFSFVAVNSDRIINLKFSDTFIFGALMVVLSLFFISRKNKSIAKCIYESRILSYFLQDIFHVKNLDECVKTEPHTSSAFAFIVGVVFGLISYAVSPVLALFILLVVAGMYLIFTAPENGVLLICLFMPVMSADMLKFIVFMTVASFIFKVIRGKRSPLINISVGSVILLGIITVSCTVISFGKPGTMNDFAPILTSIALILLVIMTVKSSALCKKCFKMLGLSALLTVFIGVYNTVMYVIKTENIYDIIAYDFTASFIDNDSCAAFLIAMIPMFILKHTKNSKVFSFTSLAVLVVSLLLCNSYYAILSLFIALVVSMIIFSKLGIWTAFIVSVCAGIFSFVTPLLTGTSIYKYMPKFEFVTENAYYSASQFLTFLKEYWLFGAGLGNESVVYASLKYNINSSHITGGGGIYSDAVIKLGLPLFVLAVILLLAFISKSVSYGLSKYKSESAKGRCASVFTSVAALCIYGGFSKFFYDIKLLALLFLLLGLSCASADSADSDYISSDCMVEYKTM